MKKFLLFFCFTLLAAQIPLAAEMNVLALAGSTRSGSYNKKLVNEAAEMARQMGATVTVIDLKDYPIPFYDADLETNQGMPKNAQRLRNLMLRHDAIMIACPEYNGSIPAVLKNALDWASRSEEGSFSSEAFEGKTFAIMSASIGRGGGAHALAHLRSVIAAPGGTVLAEQVSIPSAHEYFTEAKKAENILLKQEVEQLLATCRPPLAELLQESAEEVSEEISEAISVQP